MSQSAYIHFVQGSAVASLTLDELKQQLLQYRSQAALTGQQLEWDYADAAFPYTIVTKPEAEDQWFYLKGTSTLYKYILFGVGSKEDDGATHHHIQIVLPEDATHGDKSKANEFCKYLATKLKAELHLFNKRIMYFNPRK